MINNALKKLLINLLILTLLLSCTSTVTKDNTKVYKKNKQLTYKKDIKKNKSKNIISKEKYTKKKILNKKSNFVFSKSLNDIGRTIQKFTKITLDQINKFFAVIYKFFQKQFNGFSKTKFYKMLNEKWDE